MPEDTPRPRIRAATKEDIIGDALVDLRGQLQKLEHNVSVLQERDVRDLREDLSEIRRNVAELRDSRVQTDKKDAVDAEQLNSRMNGIEIKVDNLDSRVKDLSGVLGKIAWLIFSGFVVAIVTFIVKGGLSAG